MNKEVNEVKKVFISQPMRGMTIEEITQQRRNAIAEIVTIHGRDVEIIDTLFDDFPADASLLDFLGRAISKLAEADVAYFCDGWENARGCRIEHICAEEYGIPIMAE